jgi:ABC-type glycerol-3-phosphate transport system permease component
MLGSERMTGPAAKPAGLRVFLRKSSVQEACLAYWFITPIGITLLLIAYPFSNAIYLSLTDKIVGYPPIFVRLQNYLELWENSQYRQVVLNSVIYTVGSVGAKLVLGMTMALALNGALKGRQFFRGILLLPWIIPTVVIAITWRWLFDLFRGLINVPPGLMFIPLYQIFIKANFTNSLGTLIAAYPSFTVPFSTWFLMGFFRSIPRELEEAALIDGASRTQAFVRVILPLATPGILAAGLFCFTLAWNEFLYALIFISSDRLRTLPVGLNEFLTADVYNWGQLMGATFLAALPVVIFYIYLQKYMIQGLTAGAVKG